MKTQNTHHLTIVIAVCAILAGGVARADSNFRFEQETDIDGWIADTASTVDWTKKSIVGNAEGLPVAEGRKSLEFKMTGVVSEARWLRTSSAIPVTLLGTGRRIRLSFDIRSENCSPDDIVVRLLQKDKSGESTWVMGQADYVKVAPSKGWVSMEKIGTLLDTTTQLYLYLVQTRGGNSTGKIWLDNVSITFPENNTDYLVEAYSGSQGNIFQADTGTMTVRSNDPNYPALSVQVFDHANAKVPVTAANVVYTTVENHQTATVTFKEKGFYKVEATPGSSLPTKTWSAATIGAPVSASATDSLGIFSINSDNPSAEAAGSKWNRYFLQTEVIYKDEAGNYRYPDSYNNARSEYAVGTSTNFPSSMVYHSQSTNQQWIVCLRGIPGSLVTYSPANPRDNVNFKYQWQYYNDRAEFISLMTWVLKDLPANVEYVEAMNEPEWQNWGGTWDELGNYLKALKEAVNQANQGRALKLKLLGPGFAHIPTTSYPDANANFPNYGTTNKALLYDLLVRQGVLSSLDGIVMHAYHSGNQNSDNRPEGDFFTRLNEFQKEIPTGSKPVLITEYGWQSGSMDWQVPVSEAIHADYQSRAMLLILSRYSATSFNIRAALSFALQSSSNASVKGYSFLESDGAPRLSYVAYARTAREIQPYSGARKLQIMSSIFNAFTATNNTNKTVLALWSPTGASSVVKLPASTDSARDLYGHPKVLDSSRQITINGSPTFVTVNDSALGNWQSGTSYYVNKGKSITVEFTDMLASSEFSLSRSGNSWSGYTYTLSVSSDTGPGARNIIGKERGSNLWKNYNITVK
jgi:hypothetical protein